MGPRSPLRVEIWRPLPEASLLATILARPPPLLDMLYKSVDYIIERLNKQAQSSPQNHCATDRLRDRRASDSFFVSLGPKHDRFACLIRSVDRYQHVKL